MYVSNITYILSGRLVGYYIDVQYFKGWAGKGFGQDHRRPLGESRKFRHRSSSPTASRCTAPFNRQALCRRRGVVVGETDYSTTPVHALRALRSGTLVWSVAFVVPLFSVPLCLLCPHQDSNLGPAD